MSINCDDDVINILMEKVDAGLAGKAEKTKIDFLQ
jgi:hypothetical protein